MPLEDRQTTGNLKPISLEALGILRHDRHKANPSHSGNSARSSFITQKDIRQAGPLPFPMYEARARC